MALFSIFLDRTGQFHPPTTVLLHTGQTVPAGPEWTQTSRTDPFGAESECDPNHSLKQRSETRGCSPAETL